jgi:acetoin utilization protein AcuB
MLVKEVMTAPVIAILASDTIGHALQLMRENDIRHLPVIEDDNRVVGVISEGDVLGVAGTLGFFGLGREQYEGFLNQPINSIIKSRYLITEAEIVDQNDTLANAIQHMLQFKLTALPVVSHKGGPLVGIISYIDILLSLELILQS